MCMTVDRTTKYPDYFIDESVFFLSMHLDEGKSKKGYFRKWMDGKYPAYY